MKKNLKISIICISRWHLFDFAKALSHMQPLYQFITCFPGAKRFGIKARFSIFYRYINYYFMLALSLLPVLQKKNWFALQNKLFLEYIQKDYRPCDILVANIGSADSIIGRSKKEGALVVIEQWSSHFEEQERLIQDEYQRWWMPYQWMSLTRKKELTNIFHTAHVICVPSLFVKRSFLQYGFPEEKLFLNPYGVNTDIFYDRGNRIKDTFILINAGSQELRKGTLYNLQARENLGLKNAEFWVIGNVLPNIHDLVKPFTKNPTIKFMRSQSWNSLAKLFSQASCFVISSIEEWLAITQLQAMACGLPVISNINSGGENCIVPWVNGFMTELRNVDDIAHKIQYLYDHREECNILWKQAATYVRENHRWEQYAKKAYEKYLSLL